MDYDKLPITEYFKEVVLRTQAGWVLLFGSISNLIFGLLIVFSVGYLKDADVFIGFLLLGWPIIHLIVFGAMHSPDYQFNWLGLFMVCASVGFSYWIFWPDITPF